MDINKPIPNYTPLSPLSFLRRSAEFFGERIAVVYENKQTTYHEFYNRVRRLAAAIAEAGVKGGDTVAILAPNIPQMLEAHYAIPMIGAIINPLNVRLDSDTIAHSLDHCGAKLLICDREFLELADQALSQTNSDVHSVIINDPKSGLPSANGYTDYEEFISEDTDVSIVLNIEDENQPISLLYTSGTTGKPKGVVYSHRGAYLAALSNALSFGLDHNCRYLWTWPIFHSNGLSFVWSVTAVGGTHICARNFDAPKIFGLIDRHQVSHFCAAPLVLNLIVGDQSIQGLKFGHEVNCITGGSPPPSHVLRRLEDLGIDVTHQYGSTECYGPATITLQGADWPLLEDRDRYELMARQGLPTPAVEDLAVVDPATNKPVPRDGTTTGEILLRGNTVMRGYLGEDEVTEEVLSDGWYHSGDMAVWHTDGTIEIKDRSQDMIITGGENISSVEIEEVLYRHPDVYEAAVVAKPDTILVEAPCAFVDRVAGSVISAEELTQHCRSILTGFKVPKRFIFGALPKTATGKIKKYALREIAQTLDA